ncbi:hypothetical protein EPUS_06985 [Endocarpon pusillum Z07020]|uniref:Secreted protein n=1 Tax=Endocarpon pusillum (strain Z07020 / HMAS-L-300199) TaxID=1263415 RepID=U1GSR8_ENDPU|nr:uncharacterized protein EPUS_06985 [Endocarpon pusillum Z07020]ERF75453.1 hypothetical protein EPUS_06985 [Endocarpon pusillum Z07020]
MRLLGFVSLAYLFTITVSAQDTVTATNDAAVSNPPGDAPPSSLISYQEYETTRTIDTVNTSTYGSISAPSTSMGAANATGTISSQSSSSTSTVLLLGGQRTTSTINGTVSANATASQTSSIAQPTNTTPCNGHPSFCARKYSNITYIAAHNSPFSRPGNAASNQALDVGYQLEDGIRMLQFQTHWNETEQAIYLCHTSCDVLDVGTLESFLTRVTRWLQRNPYDIITILMGNSDVITPDKYVAPVTSSGLIDYVYTPPKVPMAVEDWPTLQEMIFANTRAVVMLDYEANQQEIPWLLDEFGQMFETPFSPTNRDFPCIADRPPAEWPGALPRENRMYIANHNLNVDISFGGISLLVPNTVILNETNAAADIYGSLKRNSLNCTSLWDRPPNFLLVDYYNVGDFNGSVFQVAADANGVSYDRDRCCATPSKNTTGRSRGGGLEVLWAFSAFAVTMVVLGT